MRPQRNVLTTIRSRLCNLSWVALSISQVMIIITNIALSIIQGPSEACQLRKTMNGLHYSQLTRGTRGNGKRAASGKCPLELCLDVCGYSSVVEHSTADREVPGSNPGVP